MTDFVERRRRLSQGTRIRVGYLLAGIPVGVLWLTHEGDTPWQHAVRLIGLMVGVMALSTVVRRVASRRGRHVGHPPVGRFLVAKGALVLVAVAVGVALQGRIANADMWIGLGLIAVIALVGPLLHPWLTASTKVAEPA